MTIRAANVTRNYDVQEEERTQAGQGHADGPVAPEDGDYISGSEVESTGAHAGFTFPESSEPDTSSQHPESPTEEHTPPQHPRDKRAKVQDCDDDELEVGGLPKDPFVRHFPRPAGSTYGKGPHLFEALHASRLEAGLGNNPWAPFADEDEWMLA